MWAWPSGLRLLVLRELFDAAFDCLALHMRADAAPAPDHKTETVAGAIVSLRRLDAYDWRQSFERLSKGEAVLRSDPSGAYATMDFASRNRSRGAIEELARAFASGEAGTADRNGVGGGKGGL